MLTYLSLCFDSITGTSVATGQFIKNLLINKILLCLLVLYPASTYKFLPILICLVFHQNHQAADLAHAFACHFISLKHAEPEIMLDYNFAQYSLDVTDIPTVLCLRLECLDTGGK